jgi:hypothetical protein
VDLPVPLDVGQADLVQGSWYPHRLVILVDDSRSDAFLEVGPWDTDGVTGVRLVQELVLEESSHIALRVRDGQVTLAQ